jgi:hypothetical protein
VSKTIESAMRFDGPNAKIAQRDREMIFQHQKFIPVPHDPGISISTSVSAAAAVASQPSVPSFEESLRGAMAAHADVQRAINATPIDPES